MQQFIQLVTSTLGTSEQTARSATGGLLNLLKTQGPAGDVTALLSKLPGASDLLSSFQPAAAAPAPPAAGAGALGSLTGAASSLLGMGASVMGAGSKTLGSAGGGLGALTGALGQSGLDISKAPQFVALFGQWASQQAGPDVVQRVLGSVPALGSMLGAMGNQGQSKP